MRLPAETPGASPTPGVPPAYFTTVVEGRRGEILDAALAVFSAKGYEAGTMREIAQLVGVTEPALYRHYTGKEALLLDLVKTAGDRMVAGAGELLDEVQPDNLSESLGALLRRRRDMVVSNRQLMGTIMNSAPHNPIVLEAFQEHFGRPMARHVSAMVPRIDAYFGIERSAEELESKVRVFMSLFIGYFMTAKFFSKPVDDEAIVEAMVAIMGWQDSPAEEPSH